MECRSCNGKGKYTGLRIIEDPCKTCGGSGVEPSDNTLETGPQEIDRWFVHSDIHPCVLSYNNNGLIETKRGEYIGLSMETQRFYVFWMSGELREVTPQLSEEQVREGIRNMVDRWDNWTECQRDPLMVLKHGKFC